MIRKILFVVPAIFLSVAALADSKILSVGSVSIDACKNEAKTIADWYTKFFGVELQEYQGMYFGEINAFIFGIHPKKSPAPVACAANVEVVYRVENFDESLSALKTKGLVPLKVEEAPGEGKFAHFEDPEGDKVSIWEAPKTKLVR